MELNEIVKQAVDKHLAENLHKIIEEKVDVLINNVLNQVFDKYSPAAKSLKEQIEESLKINLSENGLQSINILIANAVNKHLVERINQGSANPILSLIDETLCFIDKKTITLSEIYEMVLEYVKENDYQDSGKISFFTEYDSKHDWTSVYVDTEDSKSSRDCALKFMISGKTGRIFSMSHQSYHSDRGTMTPVRIASLDYVENRIFHLYSAQVNVEVDETEFENNWTKYED